MALKTDLETDVSSILSTPWSVTEGQAVPESEDIALRGGGRWLDAAMLYADLADSTALVTYDSQLAAKVFKSFLACGTRIIRHYGGEIRSFDGDRVMGVFIGKYKNTSAAKAALSLKWAFTTIVKPRLEAKYEKFKDGSLKLSYCCGVDTGRVLVVRAGMRDNNDLLWVGRAANIAAKLSTIRNDPYLSYITEAVYKAMNDEAKLHDGKEMWARVEAWKDAGAIYGSEWRMTH